MPGNNLTTVIQKNGLTILEHHDPFDRLPVIPSSQLDPITLFPVIENGYHTYQEPLSRQAAVLFLLKRPQFRPSTQT